MPFTGLTFDVAFGGTTGTVDLFSVNSGMRKTYDAGGVVCYDNYNSVTEAGTNFACGLHVTARIESGIYLIHAQLVFGLHSVNIPLITRRSMQATFTWTAGGGGSGSGFIDKIGATAKVALSGVGIPPLVLKWNSATQAFVDPVYEGYLREFEQNEHWVASPEKGGLDGLRFTFNWDNSQHPTTLVAWQGLYSIGGAWLKPDTADADGNYVRLNEIEVHTGTSDPWQWDRVPSSGWWMQPKIPSSSLYSHTKFKMPIFTHCDSGWRNFLHFYVQGGTDDDGNDIWTNPWNQIAVKRIAAGFLGRIKNPKSTYGNFFGSNFHHKSNRAKGRVITSLVWCWRALDRVREYRPDALDGDTITLQAHFPVLVLDIFQLLNDHEAENTGIYSTWEATSKSQTPIMYHPDGTKGEQLLHIQQAYQIGLYFHGLWNLWSVMQDESLTTHPAFGQCVALMKFLVLGGTGGVGAGETPRQVRGLFERFYKLDGTHPFPPPSPLPPTTATNQTTCTPLLDPDKDRKNSPGGCWPRAHNETAKGTKWSTLYYEIADDNPNAAYSKGEEYAGKTSNSNARTGRDIDELLYLGWMADSETLRGAQQIAAIDWATREGHLASSQKRAEILAYWNTNQGSAYYWRLPSAQEGLANETVNATEGVVTDLSVGVADILHLESVAETVNVTEGAVAVIPANLILAPIPETVEFTEGVVAPLAIARTWSTDAVGYAERVTWSITPEKSTDWVAVVDEDLDVGDVAAAGEVVWDLTLIGRGSVGSTIFAPADSKGASIETGPGA